MKGIKICTALFEWNVKELDYNSINNGKSWLLQNNPETKQQSLSP